MHHPDPSSFDDTPAVNRRDRFLLASVAILGVGAIAVTPVAPNTLDLQRVETHVYDLTATMDATAPPGVVYQALADNTLTNLDLLGAALTTNSAPLLCQRCGRR